MELVDLIIFGSCSTEVCVFVALGQSNSFHIFADTPLIKLTSYWVGELIVGLPRPVGPYQESRIEKLLVTLWIPPLIQPQAGDIHSLMSFWTKILPFVWWKYYFVCLQVIVMQEYKNESYTAIEAKYVFPLDDMAAVCGFEVFINGKHIIGRCFGNQVCPDSKFHVANMGPTWVLSAPGGPHVGPMKLAIRVLLSNRISLIHAWIMNRVKITLLSTIWTQRNIFQWSFNQI